MRTRTNNFIDGANAQFRVRCARPTLTWVTNVQLNLELLLKRRKLTANIKDFISFPSIFAVIMIWHSMNAPAWLKLTITILAIVLYSRVFSAIARSMPSIVELKVFVARMGALFIAQIVMWVFVFKLLSRLFPR